MRVLRIGIDARELLGDATGVGRYLGELLRRWANRPDRAERQFVLYAPAPLSLPLPPEVADHRIIGPGGRGTWWEQTSLRRSAGRDQLSAFFAPAYTAPLGLDVPLAVTIHDLSFAAHPEWFRWREGLRRRWLTRRTAQSAAVVFTDSDFSRTEIHRHYKLERDRLRVIPPGVTARAERPRSPADRDPMVLYVGSIFNRRRLPDLIAAFARATADLPTARLAIVGDDRSWPPLDLPAVARAHHVADRIDFQSYVSDAELSELYGRASVFAFLSEYEGFGLTPLEALTAGVPAVVLNTAVAREVCGDAARYVEAGDIAGTADALRQLLTSPQARAMQLAHAPSVLRRYSWDDAADRTLDNIERIAAR